MSFLIIQVILNVVAVFTGFCALLCFFIGFVDDPDFYVPGMVWGMLTAGTISISYLVTHV